MCVYNFWVLGKVPITRVRLVSASFCIANFDYKAKRNARLRRIYTKAVWWTSFENNCVD